MGLIPITTLGISTRRLATDVPRLERGLEAIGEEFGSDRRDICATRLIELWAWLVAAPVAEQILRGGCIPDPSPDMTFLSLDGPTAGWRVDFDRGEVSGPADDKVAALSGRLAEQLEPLVETLNELSGRPRRALWRSATDRLAGVFLWAGDELGQQARAGELARLAVSVPPLRGRARTQLISLPGGAVERLQVRDGCCMYYRVPGGAPCSSCPLVPDEERPERRAAELESA